MSRYESIDFTTDFMESFSRKDFGVRERRAILKALELLDADGQHPSLRLHALTGARAGQWSASASMELRITFYRRAAGRIELVECSRHYD